jgi:hypothetical protein
LLDAALVPLFTSLEKKNPHLFLHTFSNVFCFCFLERKITLSVAGSVKKLAKHKVLLFSLEKYQKVFFSIKTISNLMSRHSRILIFMFRSPTVLHLLDLGGFS